MNTPVTSAVEAVAPEPPAIGNISAPAPGRLGTQLIFGTGIYAITSFFLKALNFLLLAVYSRFLTPADYGIVALADTISATVVATTGLGLSVALVRLYFQHNHSVGELQNFAGSVIGFAAIVNAAALVLACAAGFVLDRTLSQQVRFFPFIALSLSATICLQFVDLRFGLYQVEGKTRRYAMLSLAVFALTTAGILAFVVAVRWGAYGFLLGKLAGACGAALLAVLLLLPWLRATWSFSYVREALSFGLPLVPHQLIALGLVAADRFIVARYASLADVGVYSLAYTIGMVMYTITAAVSLAWTPMFYDLAARGRRDLLSSISRALVLGLTSCAALGVTIAKPFVLWFLDPRYAAAAHVVPWVIAGYLMHALFTVFQISILQAKKTSHLPWLTGAAFLINIALNFVLVPRYGIMGAAWATFAAYAAEAVLVYFLAQRVFPLAYHVPEIMAAIVAFCGVVAWVEFRFAVSGEGQVWAGGALFAALASAAALRIKSLLPSARQLAL